MESSSQSSAVQLSAKDARRLRAKEHDRIQKARNEEVRALSDNVKKIVAYGMETVSKDLGDGTIVNRKLVLGLLDDLFDEHENHVNEVRSSPKTKNNKNSNYDNPMIFKQSWIDFISDPDFKLHKKIVGAFMNDPNVNIDEVNPVPYEGQDIAECIISTLDIKLDNDGEEYLGVATKKLVNKSLHAFVTKNNLKGVEVEETDEDGKIVKKERRNFYHSHPLLMKHFGTEINSLLAKSKEKHKGPDSIPLSTLMSLTNYLIDEEATKKAAKDLDNEWLKKLCAIDIKLMSDLSASYSS